MKSTSWRAAAFLFAWILAGAPLGAQVATWKAGVARAEITPTEPLWLAGYASRVKAAEGKVMELWVKALALEDARGARAVLVTSDTLGIPQSIYRNVCARVRMRLHLDPSQVMLTASHTHCGPVLRDALYDMYPLDDALREKIEAYSAGVEAAIIETIGTALARLEPARVTAGQGRAGFAVNRRTNSEPDVSKLIEDGMLKGPVDHSVPVLAVFLPNGMLKAVVFGYACHNTVMDFYQWSGDYAGFAQLDIEKSHPNATAMFFMGCGGDQNPLPRRQLALAVRYGHMLAAAVEEVLLAPPRPLTPELATAMEIVPLEFGPAPTEAELGTLKASENLSTQRWATRLLDEVNAGKSFARSYPFPAQAWRLGDQLLIALGGEPVVDYALSFKKEFGPQTWVVGYANDVMTYIPSQRVLREGGYEGGSANIVYGLPAHRWKDDVEATIATSVRRVVNQVRPP